MMIWVMSILLVAGLIALVVGMARTAKNMGKEDTGVPTKMHDIGTHEVTLPPGSRLISTAVDRGRIFLTLDVSGKQIILILDAVSGAELGRLELVPEAE